MKRPPFYRLIHDTARQLAASWCLEAPDGWVVSFKPPTRSLEQNALLWSRLTYLSEHTPWEGEHLTPSEWKDLFTAALRKQKVVRGIEGGLVFLGARTSHMTVLEMAELLDFIDYFAAQRGIEWPFYEGVRA